MVAPVHVLTAPVTWCEKFTSSHNIQNVCRILSIIMSLIDCQKFCSLKILIRVVMLCGVSTDGTNISVHIYILHTRYIRRHGMIISLHQHPNIHGYQYPRCYYVPDFAYMVWKELRNMRRCSSKWMTQMNEHTKSNCNVK